MFNTESGRLRRAFLAGGGELSVPIEKTILTRRSEDWVPMRLCALQNQEVDVFSHSICVSETSVMLVANVVGAAHSARCKSLPRTAQTNLVQLNRLAHFSI